MNSQGMVSQAEYHAALDNRDRREAKYRKRIAELDAALSAERARVIEECIAAIAAKREMTDDERRALTSAEVIRNAHRITLDVGLKIAINALRALGQQDTGQSGERS